GSTPGRRRCAWPGRPGRPLPGRLQGGGDAPAAARAVAWELRAEATEVRRRAAAARRGEDHGEGGFWTGLWRFLSEDVGELWNGGDDGSMPWGAWLSGLIMVGRTSVAVAGAVVRGTETVVPYGLVRRAVQALPGMGWVASAPVGVALKGAGIAGGLYGGARGAVDLVRQGNPVDAYRQEGAGYVADVAGTAFNFSSSAFLAAPNPVTGVVVVGTGATWLGAEAWDHREEIVDTWNAAAGWVDDRLDDAGEAVGDAVDDAGEAVDDLAEDAGEAAEDVADFVSFWN
ncbi:MAG TPA: hypothetical protein VHE80_06695, partial [Acidimicrobiales bacterium]|nr:hypothetical protein [Acidimicrobiales bacterium]